MGTARSVASPGAPRWGSDKWGLGCSHGRPDSTWLALGVCASLGPQILLQPHIKRHPKTLAPSTGGEERCGGSLSLVVGVGGQLCSVVSCGA